MSCNTCETISAQTKKAQNIERKSYNEAIRMAEIESMADKKVFIVVEIDKVIYHACRECWQKDGAAGTVLFTIYPPHYKDDETA